MGIPKHVQDELVKLHEETKDLTWSGALVVALRELAKLLVVTRYQEEDRS